VNFQESLVEPVAITFDLDRVVELLLTESRHIIVLPAVQSYDLLVVTLVFLSAFFANSLKNYSEFIFVEIQSYHASDINEIVSEHVRKIVRVELSPGFLYAKAETFKLASELLHESIRSVDRCLRLFKNSVLDESKNHCSIRDSLSLRSGSASHRRYNLSLFLFFMVFLIIFISILVSLEGILGSFSLNAGEGNACFPEHVEFLA
jgi:hypothetical protein